MSRQRIIHPDFFTDEDMIEIDECFRLFYIACWTIAEDSGVITLSSKSLSLRSGISVDKVVDSLGYLIDSGKIIEFQTGYGWIKNFFRYQKVPKPSPPKLPLPNWLKFKEGEKQHLNAYVLIQKNLGSFLDNSGMIPGGVQPKLSKDKLSKVKISKNKQVLKGADSHESKKTCGKLFKQTPFVEASVIQKNWDACLKELQEIHYFSPDPTQPEIDILLKHFLKVLKDSKTKKNPAGYFSKVVAKRMKERLEDFKIIKTDDREAESEEEKTKEPLF